MNWGLITNVYNQIKDAVSGITEHVYLLQLPSEELLQTISVTYELNNVSNTSTFDDVESLKVYEVEVKINAPAPDSLTNPSIYIKTKIYELTSVDTKVKLVKPIDESLFYDDELEVYTEYMRFELHYS